MAMLILEIVVKHRRPMNLLKSYTQMNLYGVGGVNLGIFDNHAVVWTHPKQINIYL